MRRYSWEYHFGIWLLDSQGREKELMVNDIGPPDGSKAVGISQAGAYILDISADGNWTVSIEQQVHDNKCTSGSILGALG